MHNMHLSSRVKLSIIGAKTLGLEITIDSAFILAIVINNEVVKTKASFLT